MDTQAQAPVLSEQMAVAPPMVSQAASTRTKLLSFIICFMLHNTEAWRVSPSLVLKTVLSQLLHAA